MFNIFVHVKHYKSEFTRDDHHIYTADKKIFMDIPETLKDCLIFEDKIYFIHGGRKCFQYLKDYVKGNNPETYGQHTNVQALYWYDGMICSLILSHGTYYVHSRKGIAEYDMKFPFVHSLPAGNVYTDGKTYRYDDSVKNRLHIFKPYLPFIKENDSLYTFILCVKEKKFKVPKCILKFIISF